jgi:hypothetical protein
MDIYERTPLKIIQKKLDCGFQFMARNIYKGHIFLFVGTAVSMN